MAGILAHGAVIAIGDGEEPEGFDPIPDPLDIEFIPPRKELVDVTSHTSTVREYVEGLLEDGKVTFQVNYSPSEPTHVQLRDLDGVIESTNFQLTFKDGTLVDLVARVNVELSHGIVNKLERMSVTLTVVSTPLYTDPT